jgi:hypothetical protein
VFALWVAYGCLKHRSGGWPAAEFLVELGNLRGARLVIFLHDHSASLRFRKDHLCNVDWVQVNGLRQGREATVGYLVRNYLMHLLG